MTHPMHYFSARSIFKLAKRLSMTGVMLLFLSACSYQDQYIANECPLPESQLMPAWHKWQEARSRPGGCGSLDDGVHTCADQRREIERVAYICPTYAPGLMASAILAYDDQQPARAQQYLDALFGLQRAHAPAAVLRGRIALEEGNIPFALRFLAEHVKLSPNDAELREVYAGALYLAGKLPEAKKQLTVAANLGAPAWRVAYHQGLFEEAGGNLHQAFQYYEAALRERADWDVALARRDGIIAATHKLLTTEEPQVSPAERTATSLGILPPGRTKPLMGLGASAPPKVRLSEVR